VRPLELLDEVEGLPAFDLPEQLSRLYGGGLGFDTPRVVANFVQTIDGVVSIPELERSNALIAGESAADRFVMALLRACADVILIGSGTLLASPRGGWQPGGAYPDAAEAFAELRRRRGRPERTAVAVVTAGGSFDPRHPLLERGALVLTTERAAPQLRANVEPPSEVVAVGGGDWVDLAAALAALHARGHGLVLVEAGPTVFSSLVAGRLVDELFLTVSPLLAGRGGRRRLSLAEDVELLPETQVGARPLSVRRHGAHLFLRYAFSTSCSTPTRG
jgi:riboflavin biosynthesis pyrimidine reductase